MLVLLTIICLLSIRLPQICWTESTFFEGCALFSYIIRLREISNNCSNFIWFPEFWIFQWLKLSANGNRLLPVSVSNIRRKVVIESNFPRAVMLGIDQFPMEKQTFQPIRKYQYLNEIMLPVRPGTHTQRTGKPNFKLRANIIAGISDKRGRTLAMGFPHRRHFNQTYLNRRLNLVQPDLPDMDSGGSDFGRKYHWHCCSP